MACHHAVVTGAAHSDPPRWLRRPYRGYPFRQECGKRSARALAAHRAGDAGVVQESFRSGGVP